MRTQFYNQQFNRINTTERIREYITLTLAYWCNQNVLLLEENVAFAQNKSEKFDWCIGGLKIAVLFEKPKALAMAAELSGWTVISLTTANHENLLTLLNKKLSEASLN
ncbi:MAG: hypothetical protein ACTHMM_11960 [Agriterribacter sp.]